jgi:hypothetical protein
MPQPVAPAHASVVSALDRAAFRAALVERMFCGADEIRDVALAPLVISREEHERFGIAARRICAAALAAFGSRRDPGRFVGDSFQQLVQALPVRQGVVAGNARFDFLPTAAGPRLVELNFVGVGTTARPHQTARALLDCLPGRVQPKASLNALPAGSAAISGCAFRSRCASAVERCSETPPLTDVANAGAAACWLSHATKLEGEPA